MRNHLTHIRGRLIDDLSRRMALRTHNLPSGRLKNGFGEKMKRFSRCRGPFRTHFLHPGHRKIDLEEFA
jgi:hypothetical protein